MVLGGHKISFKSQHNSFFTFSALRQVHYVQRRHFSLFSASLFSPLYPSSVNIQSSSIVLGLPLIFSPSILPSMMSLSRVSLLKMCPIHFFCRPRIVPISDLFSSTSCKISSFVLRSTQLIFSILHQIHISKALYGCSIKYIHTY